MLPIFRLSLLGLLVAPCVAVSQEQPPRLIVRGDDMGYSHAGNEAILKCYREGIESSVEVIAPSPWFPEAAKMLNDYPEVDVGVHLALTAEWDLVKWRPLTAAASLRDADGYFFPMLRPNANYPRRSLSENRWLLAEVEQEIRAQIELVKRKIPRVSHISAHMGCDGLSDEVRLLVKKIATELEVEISPADYKVTNVRFDARLPTEEACVASFLKMLDGLQAGKNYLLVEHPGLDTPEMRAIHHVGYEDVAQHRQMVTDVWTSLEVREAIRSRGIQLIGYRDLKAK